MEPNLYLEGQNGTRIRFHDFLDHQRRQSLLVFFVLKLSVSLQSPKASTLLRPKQHQAFGAGPGPESYREASATARIIISKIPNRWQLRSLFRFRRSACSALSLHCTAPAQVRRLPYPVQKSSGPRYLFVTALSSGPGPSCNRLHLMPAPNHSLSDLVPKEAE